MLLLIDHLQTQGHAVSAARLLLSSGRVYYRGLPTADGTRMVEPADVAVFPDAPRVQVERDPVLLFRDGLLMVAYKPAGMLPVTLSNRTDISLVASLQRRFGTILPVNQIDLAASGIMLVALAKGVQQDLRDQLTAGDAVLQSLALVDGTLPQVELTIRNTLVPNRGDGLSGQGTGTGALPAVTHLLQREDLGRYALVQASPETDQPNQIRIHLAELGNAILGDPLYAPGRLGRLLPRLALHTHALRFLHPQSRKPLSFDLPLPDDLDKACRQARAGRL